MLKRKLVQYGDDDDSHPSSRQNNGYPNKSSRIESNPQSSSSRKTSTSQHGKEESTKVDSTASSDSLSQLLGVLGNILGNNSKADLLEQLGEEGYNQCERLQSIVAQRSHERLRNGTSQSQNTSTHTRKQPEIPPPTSLTPWTASSIPQTTPPLPKILDPVREKEAFTHSAFGAFCYERLEWVGDIYVELTATLLISSTFPNLSTGKCSQLRERLVKNETLAKFSREYGFEKRAFLPPEFSHDSALSYTKVKKKEAEKVMGDIFEAYCAAIVFSDPENGVNRLANWLKALWARTLSSEILALKPQKKEDPYNPKNFPPKELLASKIASKGVKVSYKDAAPEQKSSVISGHPVFTVGAYLDGWGEEGKLLGIGTGLSKKDAGSKAAEAALANREVLRVYEDMKKEADAKRAAEQENAAKSALLTTGAS